MPKKNEMKENKYIEDLNGADLSWLDELIFLLSSIRKEKDEARDTERERKKQREYITIFLFPSSMAAKSHLVQW
jgi:hypothetical protein